MKNKPLNWKFLASIFLALVGIFLTIFTIVFKPEKKLVFNVENVVNLLDVRDNSIGIKVVFKDSIEIDRSSKNISIYTIEVKNVGEENIRINDFDSNMGFGMLLKEGEILRKPELIASSDLSYYSNIFELITPGKIDFKEKIIDAGSFFTLKLFILHDNTKVPRIESYGRISGQGAIPVLNEVTLINDSRIAQSERPVELIWISLIFTLLGFSGLIYAYWKSIQNQKLIVEQKKIIENLLAESKLLED